MKIFLSIVLFSLFAVCCNPVFAQNTRADEVVVVNGEKFIMHQVQTGETIYSLTRKYKVERSELEQYNPGLANGPSIGDVLKIPFNEGADLSVRSSDKERKPDGFRPYKIQSRRETAYYIASINGITVEELYAYNPKEKKFKRNTILKIPYWNTTQATEEVTVAEPVVSVPNTIEHRVVSGETLYSLSKKYKVSEADILRLNPGATNLKAGQSLKIPVKESAEIKTEVAAPETTFNGKYFEHIIESGETLWGITRRYGTSEKELKALNPILNTGFPAGAVLKIPVKNEAKTVQPVNRDAFEEHYVEKGETLYALSRKYGISILDIKKYNPALENRNLVYGETVLIPVQKALPADLESDSIMAASVEEDVRPADDFYEVEVTLEIPEGCEPNKDLHQGQAYRVALFLPLFLEANDTLNREYLIPDSTAFAQGMEEALEDTSIEIERKDVFKRFYRNTENFIQFYEGVLLAAKNLKEQGIEVQLQVFDSQRNADSIREIIAQPEFLQTDLIIGPIYPAVQKEIAQIAAKNRIPLVSPLASQTNLINTMPTYFQVTPSREYLAVETAEMVAEEYYNSNFIILTNGNYAGTPEGRIVELLQEKFVNAGLMSQHEGVNLTIYDFKREGPFGLRRIMSKTKENVVFIPSSDEGTLSVSISNVNNLASEYAITLIGTHRFPGYQSIQLDHYHNLKLKYVAPYWVDYTSPAAIGFIEQFKAEFSTEPDNFGIQGYDVTIYFVQALAAFGRDFSDCLPYFHIPLIQGNYHFQKFSEFGGYMNQGVSVIGYTKNYEVKRERIKGQPRLVVADTAE